MEETKEPVPFIVDLRESGIYHQAQLWMNLNTFAIQVCAPTPLQPIPAESVTECSGIQASLDCLDKTFSFVNDKNLSNLPREIGAKLIYERIVKELQRVARDCNADYILIGDVEILENTSSHYRICIHYMLMVKT